MAMYNDFGIKTSSDIQMLVHAVNPAAEQA